MEKKEIKILSRKSDLAKIQAQLVGSEISKKFPNLKIVYLTKITEGDIDKSSPLSQMETTGVFTDDLRQSLVKNECDIIVHSWKDLPIEIERSTTIAGSIRRADERDILLVNKKNIKKIEATKKISILSSSPRRIYNLKDFIQDFFPYDCNEIVFNNVRGNIPTRLKKLLNGESDALIVAKAAIDRLLNNPFKEFQELSKEIKSYIDQCLWMIVPLSINPSAPGQGALAIEIKTNDKITEAIIKNISDPLSITCVKKEREVLKKYGGGCHQKIGVSLFPTFFGLVKCEKGESEEGKKFYNWSILESKTNKNLIIKEDEIFPETILDYKFFKRSVIKDSIHKINSLNNRCVWVSRKSALPREASLSSTNIIWASGLKTWESLSSRGIWVNGCSDSMGEDFNPNITSLCQLPWIKLTHSKSIESLIKDVIYTYELVEEENLPNFTNKKYFYWMSSSAFKLAITKEPKVLEAFHACGPGNTFKEIKKMIKDPAKLSVHLSYDQWRKNLTNAR
tara:strand:- start:498 stop:2024 length:1527 start_codon:yes stop_codon:yes gene_type:complete